MRTLKELYDLLYEQIKDKESIGSLCTQIYKSETDSEEYQNLLTHLKANKPTFYRHSKFFWRPEFKYGRSFWWSDGTHAATQQRKEFIKYLRDRV